MRDDEKEAILMWGDWMRQNAKMLFLKSDEADKMHTGIQTIFQI